MSTHFSPLLTRGLGWCSHSLISSPRLFRRPYILPNILKRLGLNGRVECFDVRSTVVYLLPLEVSSRLYRPWSERSLRFSRGGRQSDRRRGWELKGGLLSNLHRFSTSGTTLLSKIAACTSLICTTSNFPTSSSATELNISHVRIFMLAGSHLEGGHWARLMSRPSSLAVAGRVRLRSTSQILHIEVRGIKVLG